MRVETLLAIALSLRRGGFRRAANLILRRIARNITKEFPDGKKKPNQQKDS